MEAQAPAQYQPRETRAAQERSAPFQPARRRGNPNQRSTGFPGMAFAMALLLGLGATAFFATGAYQKLGLKTAQGPLRNTVTPPKFNQGFPAPFIPNEPPVQLEVPLPDLVVDWNPPAKVDVVVPPPAPLTVEAVAHGGSKFEYPSVELPLAIGAPVMLEPQAPVNGTLATAVAETDWRPPYLAYDPRGDTPMKRNWKTVALLAATVVLMPQPVVMAQATNTDNMDLKDVLQKLVLIQSSLDNLKTVPADLAAVKKDINTLFGDTWANKIDLKKTSDRVEQIENSLKLLKSSGTNVAADSDVRDKLIQIEQAIAKLQGSGQPRIALSPPSAGRVVLVNLYSEELLFVINKKPQRVQPNTTVTLEAIPAGGLDYEVISDTWGLRARKTTSLTANETFTLTAR